MHIGFLNNDTEFCTCWGCATCVILGAHVEPIWVLDLCGAHVGNMRGPHGAPYGGLHGGHMGPIWSPYLPIWGPHRPMCTQYGAMWGLMRPVWVAHAAYVGPHVRSLWSPYWAHMWLICNPYAIHMVPHGSQMGPMWGPNGSLSKSKKKPNLVSHNQGLTLDGTCPTANIGRISDSKRPWRGSRSA